jgi:UDP-2,3-diacylglucosamine pyrophosphatase LpxH
MRFEFDVDEAWQNHHPRRLRALFLSDIHLGSPACKSDRLIDFLRHHEADTLYLVGDIVDGWRLSAKWYWPAAHDQALHAILRAVRQGTRLVYVPGNHDAFMRDYYGRHFAGIEVVERATHVTADRRRYLVTHGDHVDPLARRRRGVAALGRLADHTANSVNAVINLVRRQADLPYWSLSRWTKHSLKTATNLIGGFERAVADYARQHSADGVICGHIHHPANHRDLGIHYVNCGDWIESCTAAAERFDGSFEIVSWPTASDVRAKRERAPAQACAA